MTRRKVKNPHQIVRLDNKNTFLEIMDNNFDKERVLINFCEYDRSQGNKMTKRVPIYLTFPEFYNLLNGITVTTAIYKLIDSAPRNLYTYKMSGTAAYLLERYGRTRPDGKSESRILSLGRSTKFPGGIMFVASKGPGEVIGQGMVKPAGAPDERVQVIVDYGDLVGSLRLVEAKIQSYLNFEAQKYTEEYFKNPYSFMDQNQNNKKQKTNQYQQQQQNQYQQQGTNQNNTSAYSGYDFSQFQ